jgi:catechol 2,3-dioxygenase-like lactoylglutathione lyase family enzyme
VDAHIDIVTLAVADLERALAFYRDGLGLETAGITGTQFTGDDTQPAGDVVMFQLDGGAVLALYPRSELAVVPEQVGSSGPPWRLSAVKGSSAPRRQPDEASR